MRFNHFAKLVAVSAVFVLALALTSLAQSIVTGAVSGTVTDPSGAAVAGATVTIDNLATGETSSGTTTDTGGYLFSLLKPGSYTVTVQHEGFKQTAQSIQVLVGQTVTTNIQLELGSTSSTVEVTGAAPVLQTENANITSNFTQEQIQNIPNPGNDITYVANTAPGVVMNNSTVGGYGNFSAFGLPATANLFTINGNDYNDPFLNLNNTGSSNLLLGNNDIQEFVVVSNGYTAQYGRQAGAQIDYTTKSGTNSFHGNMVYNWTGRALNANDPINKLEGGTRPFENNNQWAAQVGGPIVKDKLFFSVDTEGIRYIFGSTASIVAPSPAFETYVLGNVPQDAATQAFYNNIFKLYNGAGGISRATLDDGSCGGITAIIGANQDCTESWVDSLSNGNKEWLLIGRVDYNAGANDKIYGRFKMDRGTQPTYTDPINVAFDNQSVQPQDEGQLNYTHIFSPNIVNNFIGSVLWYSAIFGSQNPTSALNLFPGNLVFLDGSTATSGSISALGTGSGSPNGFVAGFLFPQGRDVTQWGLVDDLSITRGSHAFKMGVNFRRDDVSDHTASELTQYPVIQTSMFGFANDQISPACTLLAVGACGPGGSVLSNFAESPVQPIAIYSIGTYFQDEWRASSKLKLTLAARLERNSGGSCQHACATLPASPFSDLSHSADTPYNQSFLSGATSIANVEKFVFEPRFGFAWTPVGDSTVLRGGIGVFSDLYPGVVLDAFTTNFPEVNVWNVNPGTATLAFDKNPLASTAFPDSGPAAVQGCNAAFSSNYASGGNLPSLITAYGSLANPTGCFSSTGTPLVPNYNEVNGKLLNPKYLEWNFEIQHSFGRSMVLSVNYVGNHGWDELLQNPYLNAFCDANCTNLGLTNTGLPSVAPDPRVGSVLALTNNAYSNYNGVTFSLKENNWHGLMYQFNYTYSHALDVISNGGTGETPFSVITSLGYQIDPFNPSASYGNADYDARQNLSANYVYQLPFKSENRMMDAAIGGWQVSGTFFFHTGFPFSAIDDASIQTLASTNNMNHGIILLQPVSSFTQRNFPNGRQCAQWLVGGPTCFTTADFAPDTNFVGDVVGRNAFTGPGFFGADFSLRKGFRLTERAQFQVGVNVFNVFNHTNIGAPWASTNPALPFGGSFFTAQPPTSPYGAFAAAATDMRMAQIMARFEF